MSQIFVQHLDWPNGSSTLATGGYTAGSGVINVATGTGIIFGSPSPSSPIRVTLASALTPSTVAHYTYTGRSSDQLTGVTVLDGTDQNFLAGDTVECRIYAADFNDAYGVLTTLLGISGIVKCTSGTLAAAVAGTDYLAPFGSTTANEVYASPNGSAGVPSFRALVAADIPNIAESQVTGLATSLNACLQVANNLSDLNSVSGARTNLGLGSLATANQANLVTQVSGQLGVANGGTGDATLTAYAVLCGGTTSTGAVQSVSGLGSSGQVLTSNGASALPTWQPASGGGSGTVNSGTAGQLSYYASSGTAVSGATNLTVGASSNLNLASQAAPGSPNAGDIWPDSTQIALLSYINGAKGAHPRLIFRMTNNTTVGSSSGSQTLITPSGAVGSLALQAGFMNEIGKGLWCRFGGYITTTASPGNFFFFVKLGSTCVATTVSQTILASQTQQPFQGECKIVTKATGTSGKLVAHGVMGRALISSGTQWEFSNGSTPGTQAVATQGTLDLTQAYTYDFQINLSATVDTIVLDDFELWETY